jgi:hypothetical protein
VIELTVVYTAWLRRASWKLRIALRILKWFEHTQAEGVESYAPHTLFLGVMERRSCSNNAENCFAEGRLSAACHQEFL